MPAPVLIHFFRGMTTSNVVGLDAIAWACTLLLAYPAINSSVVVCMCVFVRLHVCNGCKMTCEDMIVCLSCHCYFRFSGLHTLCRHTHAHTGRPGVRADACGLCKSVVEAMMTSSHTQIPGPPQTWLGWACMLYCRLLQTILQLLIISLKYRHPFL